MVLPLVSCWWCSLLLLLSRECNNQPLQSVVMAGGGWQQECHRLNSSTSLSQDLSTKKNRAFLPITTVSLIGRRTTTQQPTNKWRRGGGGSGGGGSATARGLRQLGGGEAVAAARKRDFGGSRQLGGGDAVAAAR